MNEYLSCAETAKLVRAALAETFPAVKFSVQSKNYSGGASISVGWVEGPQTKDVERVVGYFEGAEFDGMIDLKSNRPAVLVDGKLVRLGINRPLGSRVRFLADYIFCRRETAAEHAERQRWQAEWDAKKAAHKARREALAAR